MPELWTIRDHDDWDKSFRIDGPLPLDIDFDDVNHSGVDILAQCVVATLNAHWVGTPSAYTCKNEDCDNYWQFFGLLSEDVTHCPECGQPGDVEEVSP